LRRPEPRWIVRETGPGGAEAEVQALARRLSVPALVARLLWLRGHRGDAEARAFLSPRLSDLRPPDRLPDIGKAAERLQRAVRKGQRIAVFGDYDVDGMTGTALLVRFFRLAGADVLWRVPEREGEGYGLSVAAVEDLAAKGARVLVTVDNGIGAHAPLRRAAELGLDVVVTDHHLPPEVLPEALALVTPHRKDGDGEGRLLCGCALAFKTAWAVADRLRQVSAPGAVDAFREFLRDAVGYAALATVSDVVPLVGENRILVAAGLGALRRSTQPGLRALLAQARVGALPLTTEDVAFRLAPRLNAAGRLSRPDLVIDLLTTADEGEARRLAAELDAANDERRRIEKTVLDAAHAQADQVLAAGRRHTLVVHGEGWHRGVIGIVASRLVDRHHRPTVVIGFDRGVGRGSCRTPEPVDLHAALTDCHGHLTRYGGHAAAAGLEIGEAEVARFADAFEAAVEAQVGTEGPGPVLWIDGETAPGDWTLDVAEAFRRLGPFGAGNPEPQFLIRKAEVAGRARLMGKDAAHLSFALKHPEGAIRVVAFRAAASHDVVASGKPLDLVVTPTVNDWRGTRTPELRLVDVRPHGTA
jgi:single-stranded-DNA-specific exonuclease